MLADILGQLVFELLPWPATALWPRLTKAAEGRGALARTVIGGCAVLVIAGVYILAMAVVIGTVVLITSFV